MKLRPEIRSYRFEHRMSPFSDCLISFKTNLTTQGDFKEIRKNFTFAHLSLAGAGLCREVNKHRKEFILGEIVHEFVFHVHTLARACGTHKLNRSEE